LPYGTDVLAEGDHQEGIRWLVLRGPIGTPCAYVGIPLASPAAGLNTAFLEQTGPSPHGGWTYAGEGDGVNRPEGWYWWGWDYAHSSDWIPYLESNRGHRWTTDEVVAEIRELLPAFEVWLRSGPEEQATVESRRPAPTILELKAQAEQLLGVDCLDWALDVP
jgi:hypothetical protein